MNGILALKRLHLFHDYVKKSLHVTGKVEYASNKLHICSVTKLDKGNIRVAISPDLLDSNSKFVKEYDFIEACISVAHELHHSAVLSQSRKLNNDMIVLSESYVSRFDNNETYKSEYDKFSYEIAAERYALRATYEYFCNKLPALDTEAIMLDYVNAKAMSDNKEYAYFIHTKTGFTSMQEVFDAFDEAYEKSFETKKNFDVEGNHIHETLASDDRLKQGFDRASDGREQTTFAAIINLQDDTSLFRIFKTLKPKDYDL